MALAAGNAVVDGVVASNFGVDAHLPVQDTFAVKHAAGAKMRLAHRAAPWLLRLLHSWRLLTPLHHGISAIGKQVTLTFSSSRRIYLHGVMCTACELVF